jgi:hypothetical protein
MSTIPQIDPKKESHVLAFQEWGWQVRLCKKGTAVSLVVSTPHERGYSLEVDEEGNVIEHISGNYLRIVEGSVEEKTFGATLADTDGPRVLRSSEYTVIAAPAIHLNPEEFKEEE